MAGQHQRPTAFVMNVAMTGLSAMRSLGRAGIPVVGIDPIASHIGFASRYGTSLKSPHPVKEPDQLLRFLEEQAQLLDEPGVLSPASDAMLLFVSRYRQELARHFRFIVPPSEVAESAVNKRQLYELCAKHGVPFADTQYPTSMQDIHALKHELEYPVFIKPYYSHLWEDAFPGGKGFKVFSAGQLVDRYERIFDAGQKTMIQSIIQGPASNVRTVYMYFTEDGELLGRLTTRKIRQFPVEFGRGRWRKRTWMRRWRRRASHSSGLLATPALVRPSSSWMTAMECGN